MDLRKLKTLIDLVSESNISELDRIEASGKIGMWLRAVESGLAMKKQTGASFADLPGALKDPQPLLTPGLPSSTRKLASVLMPLSGRFSLSSTRRRASQPRRLMSKAI